jgi:hypothetical protein
VKGGKLMAIQKMVSIILMIAITGFSMTALSDNAGDSSEPTMTLIADAGPDQTANEGETVHLSGSASAVIPVSYPLWPVDISADGRFLAVGWDKNVTFFSTSSNVPLWTFNTATDGKVGDMKLSDDGRYLTVGSYRTIFYFDTTSSTPLWSVTLGDSVLRYDGDPGNRMDMSFDGRFVAASATGQRMVMFDTTSATPTTPYWDYAYGDHVECVRFSGDARYLSIGSFNGRLKLASVLGRSILWTANPGDRVYSTSISHDGSLISIGRGNSHRVSMYSSASSSPLWTTTLEGRQFEQALSYNGDYLASGNHFDGMSGTWSGFAFWDTSNSNPIWTYTTGAAMSIYNADAVDMDDNANYVVGGSRDYNVYLFSQLADGSPGWSSLDGTPAFIYTTGGMIHYNGVSMSSDGTYFAAGSWEGIVYLFSTNGTPHLLWTWSTNSTTPFGGPIEYYWDINHLVDSDGDSDPVNDADLTGQTISYVYGDDGVYIVTLTVSDDQGNSATDTSQITVNNVNPHINPLTPLTTYEGSLLELSASSSDPGSDDLTYTWQFEFGPTVTHSYYNNDLFPDPPISPWGTFPFSTLDEASHTYGDDGEFLVSVTVTDDDGGTASDSCTVTVLNIDPEITIESALMDVEIILRVAGSKWSNVGLTLYEEDIPIGYIEVERWPGSPDNNPTYGNPTLPVTLDMTKSYKAIVTYDPYPDNGDFINGDQPNNGKDKNDNAGNPVWVVIAAENGNKTMIPHTFNTQQSMIRNSEHWNHVEPWEVDLTGNLTGCVFEITTHITDPGSDDEAATCVYGTQNFITTYLNNPPDPDPYPSPEINPVDITAVIPVSYEDPGILSLQVMDDDGGVDIASLTLL